MRKTFDELKKLIDGNDPFMTNGHQILKIRGRKRICPEWAKHDKQVRGLLKLVFPKLETNPKQRARAGRWVRIVHLYFRKNLTCSAVAEEMGEKTGTIRSMLKAIQNAAKGRPCNGQKKARKRYPIQTYFRSPLSEKRP